MDRVIQKTAKENEDCQQLPNLSIVAVLEYDVHGKILATGVSYDNRIISVITIEDRKVGNR